MTDALPRLCTARLSELPDAIRPQVDPRDREVGIVHLGIGAFHRAHQAWYTERSGGWGICGVTQRTDHVVRQLAPQDGLYTLVQRDGDEESMRVLGAVREVLFAGANVNAVVARIGDPAIAVVTLTVTEKGYRYDPATGVLASDDPEIVSDLEGRPPHTVVGQLARAIAMRARAGGAPLTVLSCDNIPSNGRLLGGLVAAFLSRTQQPEPALSWMAANVTFPTSMVDRIVPATTDADRARVARALGMEDHAAVVTEPFAQWVIEDRFAGRRPAWESAGALLVDDVSPYEALKIRLLNGSHSALAYLGGLAGFPTIADAIANPTLARYVDALMQQDSAPTLISPPGIDLRDYQLSVMRRFANPALGHRPAQIAMDGSHKLPQRLLGTIRDRRAAGGEPVHAALAVAAWMRHVTAGIADDGSAFAPDDPLLTDFQARVPPDSAPDRVVEGLLGVQAVFADLADDGWLRSTLTTLVGDLQRHGALAVTRGLDSQPSTATSSQRRINVQGRYRR